MDDIQDHDPTDNGGSADPSTARSSGPRRLPKKRTKTGCLTCRKRRIKCGEEKPICTNCVKSKRICEGYAQRVVFKNPIGIFGSFNAAHNRDAQMQQHYMGMPMYNDYGAQLPPQQAAAAAQHPMLAPRPVDPSTMGYQSFPSQMPPSNPTQQANGYPFYYPNVPPTGATQAPTGMWPAQYTGPPETMPTAPVANDLPQTQQSVYSSQVDVSQRPQPNVPNAPHLASTIGQTAEEYASNLSPLLALNAVPEPDREMGQIPQITQPLPTIYHYQPPPGQLPQQSRSHEQYKPQVMYMEDESEDYYDVDSDDEMVDQSQAEGFNQLSLIMASANYDERKLRSFTTYLNEPNILASYRPSLGSSPLNNPKTARIFAHFIHSTGPSLSIFERHPTDSSIILGAAVPSAQQGLWTYTLALKALEHPALLQAILAVSSLHIAYLQQAPTTVSLKHYHYALKRVGSAVGLPLRRKQVGTLAATLLLGYYEVISADHSKWNNHVAGSAHLIREIDFARTTRDLRAYRRRVIERRQSDWSNSWWGMQDDISEDDPFSEKESNVDEDLIGALMGRAVSYDYFGAVDEGNAQPPKKNFTRKDIEVFRIQCDLYWWYSKQDAFQSFIGGNKLLMPYSQWGQCPPRAGVGRLDAIYGSSDHLWLLLARATDFAFRDRKRKLRALKASGHDWRPGPEMFKFMGRFAGGPPGQKPGPPGGPPGNPPGSHAPGPPNVPPGGPPRGPSTGGSGGGSQSSGSGPPSADSPPMYGMIPPQPPPRLPTGFQDRPRGSPSDEDDQVEDMSFKEAEQEWEDILVAMETFAYALGHDFQPLPVDVAPQIATPFGPALQYRTHTIAVIWGYYYAVRILLNRIHPSMPPAIMMAAGVAAPTTANLAQLVGKIMAGIYYPQRFNLEAGSLSPNLGSSLTEMTVPIFFAAVQYIDSTQRTWTISKLRDISRLTGWRSAEAIAGGCEKAWIVAGKQGRAPPYQRSFETSREREWEREHRSEAVLEEVDDRRFVTVKPDRAHWAMGILEEEIANLEV